MLLDLLGIILVALIMYGVYWLCDIDWDEYRKTNSEG
jgi:hypothetical protein